MKEVEKLFKEWLGSKNLKRIGYRYYDVVNWDGAEPEERFYNEIKLKEAFIAGFNADKWHYPSKGEYPPKGRQVLAYAWNVHNVLAKYDTFDGEDRFVTFDAYNGFIEIKKVIRWQYIVPPKEEAHV